MTSTLKGENEWEIENRKQSWFVMNLNVFKQFEIELILEFLKFDWF